MRHITFCLIMLAASPVAGREWTTASGFKFEAGLIGFEGDQIQLRLDDGPITVPLSLLSAADRRYVEMLKGPVVVSGPVMPAAPVVPAQPSRPTIAELAEERLRAWREAERERQETTRRRPKSRRVFIRVNGCGPCR